MVFNFRLGHQTCLSWKWGKTLLGKFKIVSYKPFKYPRLVGEKILICLLQKLSSSAAWPKYLINASWECGAGRRKQVAHLYLGLKKFSNEFSIFCVCIWDSKSSPKCSQYLGLYMGLKKFSRELSISCVCNWDSKISQYFVFLSGTQKVLQRVLNILCLYLGLQNFSKELSIFCVCI